jgi:hypothetical protein
MQMFNWKKHPENIPSYKEQILKLCNDDNNVDLDTLFGIYLGYPRCCIESLAAGHWAKAGLPCTGTGYVPCFECRKKPEEELLDYIEKYRLCDLPFPECDDIMGHQHFTDMVLYGDLINIATY